MLVYSTFDYSVPVFQGKNSSWSVAFSPADPMLVASGGSDGTKLFDIRQNSFRYMEIDLFRELICAVINSLFLFKNADSFSSPFGTTSARLDRRGSRLLCREFRQFPVVYDVPTEQQMGVGSTGKIQFSAQRCSPYLSDKGIASPDKRTKLFQQNRTIPTYQFGLCRKGKDGTKSWTSPSPCWKATKDQFIPSATINAPRHWPLPELRKSFHSRIGRGTNK